MASGVTAVRIRALALLARRSATEQYSSPLEPAAGRGRKMSASLKVCLPKGNCWACLSLSGSLATWKLLCEGQWRRTAKGLTVENASRPLFCLPGVFLAVLHCCQPGLSQGPQCLLAAVWGSPHSVGWSPSHLAFVHLEVEAWRPPWGLY